MDRRAGLLLAALAPPLPAAVAQQPEVPFVTIDQDRLFAETRYGQRLISEIRADEKALAEENRRIEDRLKAEERELTEKRETMAPKAFRKLADEFDDKVVAIRKRQDGKQHALQSRLKDARETFWVKVRPVLAELVRDKGAVAILNDRAVVLSARSINITDAAIARIDKVLGAGGDASGGDASGGDGSDSSEREGAATGARTPDTAPGEAQ